MFCIELVQLTLHLHELRVGCSIFCCCLGILHLELALLSCADSAISDCELGLVSDLVVEDVAAKSEINSGFPLLANCQTACARIRSPSAATTCLSASSSRVITMLCVSSTPKNTCLFLVLNQRLLRGSHLVFEVIELLR